jgi:hypothetical protein
MKRTGIEAEQAKKKQFSCKARSSSTLAHVARAEAHSIDPNSSGHKTGF